MDTYSPIESSKAEVYIMINKPSQINFAIETFKVNICFCFDSNLSDYHIKGYISNEKVLLPFLGPLTERPDGL